MSQTNISVSFAPGSADSGFRLEYAADDNVLPSKVEGALDGLTAQLQAEGAATIARYPTLWGGYASAEIAAAVKEASRDPKVRAGEQLYQQDEAAWPVRRIRMYPPGAALLTCNYGTVLPRHVVTATLSETLIFAGTDRASLDYIGHGANLSAVGRVYDTTGALLPTLELTYASGEVVAPVAVYGIVDVSYQATYQVVELTVTPTGEDFQVLVAAFRGGEHTSVVVPFEILEFDPVEEKVEIGTGGYVFGTAWPPVEETVDDELTSTWTESGRVMSDVDVDGVTIKRIEEVTFNRGSGAPVTLRFDNSGVS